MFDYKEARRLDVHLILLSHTHDLYMASNGVEGLKGTWDYVMYSASEVCLLRTCPLI